MWQKPLLLTTAIHVRFQAWQYRTARHRAVLYNRKLTSASSQGFSSSENYQRRVLWSFKTCKHLLAFHFTRMFSCNFSRLFLYTLINVYCVFYGQSMPHAHAISSKPSFSLSLEACGGGYLYSYSVESSTKWQSVFCNFDYTFDILGVECLKNRKVKSI